MNWQHINSVYFLGIGGIGMSALARWFNAQGKSVSGYDKVPSSLTKLLETEGIAVHFNDDPELIPETVKSGPDNSLIIYTPAIPALHYEKKWFLDNGFELHKRAEILGMLSKAYKTIAIAGTHGKTSVTSMLAHVLHQAGVNVSAFVGGIMKNYDSNIILGDNSKSDHYLLAEADEFDRSFLKLHPKMAVITIAEADHLDIYHTASELENTFKEFADLVPSDGYLFVQARSAYLFHHQLKSYGINDGDIQARNVRIIEGYFIFDLVTSDIQLEGIKLQVHGFHNIENALAASAVAIKVGLDKDALRAGLESFKGVSRRFDFIIRNEDKVYIDDYAHHPTEISAFLTGVKSLYPEKKITAIFQPHLYSRTRDFATGFSQSLSLADSVIILPIYPAREEPIPGVVSDMLLEDITSTDKKCLSPEDALAEIKNIKDGVLLTIGAGDIDRLVPKIKEAWS